jgi:hypothetical protein
MDNRYTTALPGELHEFDGSRRYKEKNMNLDKHPSVIAFQQPKLSLFLIALENQAITL